MKKVIENILIGSSIIIVTSLVGQTIATIIVKCGWVSNDWIVPTIKYSSRAAGILWASMRL